MLLLFLFFIIKILFLLFSFLFFISFFFIFNCQWNCMLCCFPKERKISTLKPITSENLTCWIDKSIYNFLLLNQLSRPSVMLYHILNYQHLTYILFERIKCFNVRPTWFMNFIQIGRYTRNANVGCHFPGFLSSMLINYEIKNMNHFLLKRLEVTETEIFE